MSSISDRLRSAVDDERGSSPVEFVLVGTLLTLLTIGILQFGLAVYVRNVVHDAAVEGAHHAALADTTPADGRDRTDDIITRTIGAEYAQEITVRDRKGPGYAVVEVRVQTTLPLIGLLGVPRGLEVTAVAPTESLDG